MKKILLIMIIISSVLFTGCQSTQDCYKYSIVTNSGESVLCNYHDTFMGGYKASECIDNKQYYNYESKELLSQEICIEKGSLSGEKENE